MVWFHQPPRQSQPATAGLTLVRRFSDGVGRNRGTQYRKRSRFDKRTGGSGFTPQESPRRWRFRPEIKQRANLRIRLQLRFLASDFLPDFLRLLAIAFEGLGEVLFANGEDGLEAFEQI